MANHKSAEKRARQTVRKTEINSQTKSTVRTWEKKLRKAISDKDQKQAAELLVAYTSKAGKAVQKGVYKTQTISRKVGRLSQQVHQLAVK